MFIDTSCRYYFYSIIEFMTRTFRGTIIDDCVPQKLRFSCLSNTKYISMEIMYNSPLSYTMCLFGVSYVQNGIYFQYYFSLRRIKMDQRKLTENQSTLVDMAKVCSIHL